MVRGMRTSPTGGIASRMQLQKDMGVSKQKRRYYARACVLALLPLAISSPKRAGCQRPEDYVVSQDKHPIAHARGCWFQHYAKKLPACSEDEAQAMKQQVR